MKAAMYYEPLNVKVVEMDIPEIEKDEVLVKVKTALTCGTDVKTYLRGHPTADPPMPFGHEFAGDIVEVGSEVKNFKEGMRVVAHNSAPDGTCFYCKAGIESMCETLFKRNLKGAFAEYVKVPGHIVEKNMFRIPDNISYETAALLEPLSCAVYGIERSKVKLGDTVAVLGAGPIGLMFVKLASLKGARVICSDFNAERLKAARALSASEVVQVSAEMDQVRALRNLTENERGADVVIEATGVPEVWEDAIDIARKGGLVNLFGGCKPGTTITLDTKTLHYSELTVIGVYHTTPYHVKVAFDLLCRELFPSNIFVSGRFPLDKVVDALEAHGKQKGVKFALVLEG